MGSHAHGILWGVERPKGINFNGDEDFTEGVFERVKKARAVDIEVVAKRLRCTTWDAEKRFVPDMTYDESDEACHLLGFWVAVGGSGMRGIPYLGTVQFNDITSGKSNVYSRALKNACIRWRRFASWCATENIVALPKAQLWMTITETA